MKSQKVGLRVAGTVFGLGCLGQFFRLVAQIEVLVGGHPVPLWPSAIAVVMAGALCVWLWKLSTLATT